MLFAFYAMVIMCKGILAEGKQFNGQTGEIVVVEGYQERIILS